MAIWELAPGSPWKTMRCLILADFGMDVPRLTAGE
jgi:hypothetical protein